MGNNTTAERICNDEMVGTLLAISVTAKMLAKNLAVQYGEAKKMPKKEGVKHNGKRKMFAHSRRTS